MMIKRLPKIHLKLMDKFKKKKREEEDKKEEEEKKKSTPQKIDDRELFKGIPEL